MSVEQAQPAQPANDPVKTGAAAVSTAAEAVRDGATDAAARVRQVVPVAGQFVSRFVYSSCYFLSYGVVFPTMVVASYLPGGKPIATGLVDGAQAASDLVREMKVKRSASCAESGSSSCCGESASPS
ncbi:MAG: hypothetical protein ACKV0T_16755 [Planctomycetales bacterium]